MTVPRTYGSLGRSAPNASRVPYVYAVSIYLVLTCSTSRAESSLLRIPNGACMQTPDYELRRIYLPRTRLRRPSSGAPDFTRWQHDRGGKVGERLAALDLKGSE